tara:strand:+ start:110 stop:385 length:276 start_codon:yes stop_codon:yes gene_type:complete
MEVIKSRYGLERVIEKLDSTRIRITGESQFQRTSTNDVGETIMFDFEGGPVLSIGGSITFQKSKWVITAITPIDSKYEGIVECIIGVKLSY